METMETVEAEMADVVESPAVTKPPTRVIFDLRSVFADAAESGQPTSPQTMADEPVEPTARPIDEPRPDVPLHGRMAIVTGGASGAGREIALGFAAAGARVCVIGGDVAQLRDTVERAGPGAAMVFLQCDVGSLVEIDGVVDFINRFDRPVDVIVHAEATRVAGSLGDGAVQDLDEQYLVNVRGPYLLTQRLLPRLVEARGRVVFLRHLGGASFAQHALVSETIGAFAEGLRREAGESISVSSIVSDPGVGDDAVTAAVMYVATAPPAVEVGEIRMRARTDAVDGRSDD